MLSLIKTTIINDPEIKDHSGIVIWFDEPTWILRKNHMRLGSSLGRLTFVHSDKRYEDHLVLF